MLVRLQNWKPTENLWEDTDAFIVEKSKVVEVFDGRGESIGTREDIEAWIQSQRMVLNPDSGIVTLKSNPEEWSRISAAQQLPHFRVVVEED